MCFCIHGSQPMGHLVISGHIFSSHNWRKGVCVLYCHLVDKDQGSYKMSLKHTHSKSLTKKYLLQYVNTANFEESYSVSYDCSCEEVKSYENLARNGKNPHILIMLPVSTILLVSHLLPQD